MCDKDFDAGYFIGHFPCIASEVDGKEDCCSSDGLAIYEHDAEDGQVYYDGYCYSCSQSFTQEQTHNSSVGGELGVEGGIVVERKDFERKPKREPITKDEIKKVLGYGYEGKGYRGLKDEYNQFFGHTTKLDKHGRPVARFYPETKDGKLMGYKSRIFPKAFGYENYGQTGKHSDLSGQVKFKDQHFRDIVIVGGEEDKTAFFQIFSEYQKSRKVEGVLPMPVVSPTTGEGSALKQIRQHYDFINRAENIYLGLDNDEVGRAAMEEIGSIFPKEKVKLIYWSTKDPNAAVYNKEGVDRSKQCIRDFYNAKPLDNAGIVGSGQLDDAIEQELLVEKIPLPSFMSKLQDMMAGGIPLGYILNLCGETGGGKTSFVNEMIYEWIFNSPHKMGIVSLELTSAQYGIAMLSRHIGKKLNLFTNGQDAVDYIRQPHILEKRKQLWTDEYGRDRWVLLDERDGSLSSVQKQCELLHFKHGCKLLVLDPLQDILDGATIEEQSVFMRWQKKMVKEGITFININHTRKGSGKGANGELRDLIEDDIHGSSAIAKSGGANIFLMRDKYGETDIEKNTTYIKAGKIRWTGKSGWAGKWFYENEAHTIHDFDTYFNNNPHLLPAGFDREKSPFDKGNKKQQKQPIQNAPDFVDLPDGAQL